MYSSDFKKQQKVGQTQYVTQFTVSEVIGFLNEFGTPAFVYERMFQDIEMYYFDEQELTELKSQTFALDDMRLAKITGYTEKLLRPAKPSEVDIEQVDEKDVNDSEKTSETDVLPKTDKIEIAEKELTQKIQARLAALGCNPGPADGIWGKRTQAAASLFSKHAKPKFNGNWKSAEFLEAMLAVPGKACPTTPVQQKKAQVIKSEIWNGYYWCQTLLLKRSSTVIIRPIDANKFELIFSDGLCGNTWHFIKKTFELPVGQRKSSHTFSLTDTEYNFTIDFDKGRLEGTGRETDPAMKLLLGA
ncbi:hypothetical protein N9E31_00880 [Paracoccaceae bacterium]|nr:hypothetical protein [Paracoccaceae bacterium]